MPELPEVEQARRYIHDRFRGMKITRVEAEPDLKLFHDTTNEAFIAALTGKTVVNTHRSGKLFYIELDSTPYPLFHFGMTGSIIMKGEPGFMCTDVDKENSIWPPRFTKLIVHFNSTYELAFLDPRRFAKIRLQNSPLTELPIKNLGFDPLHSMPSFDTFLGLIARRKGPIKSVLLDQSFCAGIGNWIADEILYHALIHPSQPTTTLVPEELRGVYDKIVYVIQTAVDCNEREVGFPAFWMFHQRWAKGSGKKAAVVDESGKSHAITFVTVGGRTSAVIALQKLVKSRGGVKKEVTIKVEVKACKVESTVTDESVNGERRTTRKRARVDYTIQPL